MRALLWLTGLNERDFRTAHEKGSPWIETGFARVQEGKVGGILINALNRWEWGHSGAKSGDSFVWQRAVMLMWIRSIAIDQTPRNGVEDLLNPHMMVVNGLQCKTA